MGLFGISLGAKKSTTNQTTDVDKTTVGTQNTNSTQNQTQTGTQNVTGTTASQGVSRNDTSGASASQTTGTTAEQQKSTSKTYSDATLGALESRVQAMLANPNLGQIQQFSDFDPAAYVRNGMSAATARAQTSVDEALGGIYDQIGGRNNSAAALLQQRVQNDSNANLAGVNANLTGQAEEIRRQNLLAGNTVTATSNDLVTNILAALKGGTTQTEGTGLTQSAQNNQQQNIGTNVGSQSQTGQSSQQTQSTEQLINVLAQLINSNERTTGTEKTVGTTKSGGFGIST